jgi:hypothetical protein
MEMRNDLVKKQENIYIQTMKRIDMKLTQDDNFNFRTTLFDNCAKDFAGEVVRRFFDTADYYVTVDQMFFRIKDFSYENECDFLKGQNFLEAPEEYAKIIKESDEKIRKQHYNVSDSAEFSKFQQTIREDSQNAQEKLFTENRKIDRSEKKPIENYKESKRENDGRLRDEITRKIEGEKKTIIRNGKEVDVSNIHADHVQSREAATYNSEMLSKDSGEKLKEFYNSPDNFQLMHASANTSKGDVRVCVVNGEIKAMTTKDAEYASAIDITNRATPDQYTDAVITQLEKGELSSPKINKLQEEGYLDENGKVKPEVKAKLKQNIVHSQNQESLIYLKDPKVYKTSAKKAAAETKKSFGKILAGQFMYYGLPPIVYELKLLISKKGEKLSYVLDDLKDAFVRIAKYMKSKMKDILKALGGNVVNSFLKKFFDIIIELVKATVKRMVKAVKRLVIGLTGCVGTIMDKNATPAQKGDAVIKTLAVTVNGIALEIFFEFLENQLHIPNFLMEVLQVIVTVISTNLIMLVLEEADLFNVKYGMKMSNIEALFENEREAMRSERLELESEKGDIEFKMEKIKEEIQQIEDTIDQIDVFSHDSTEELDKLNHIFNMEIDLNEEWESFAVK